MANILAISSALPYVEITLVSRGRTLYYAGWYSDYDEAEKLLYHLRKIFALNERIDGIAVVSGPGGFTGLRAGVTIANTLAAALNVKVKGIDSDTLLKKKSPRGTVIVHRAEAERFKDIIASNGRIKYATGDLSADQVDRNVPQSVRWIELKDLKPLNEVVTGLSAGAKMVKPRYFAPPKITASKKKIFK